MWGKKGSKLFKKFSKATGSLFKAVDKNREDWYKHAYTHAGCNFRKTPRPRCSGTQALPYDRWEPRESRLYRIERTGLHCEALLYPSLNPPPKTYSITGSDEESSATRSYAGSGGSTNVSFPIKFKRERVPAPSILPFVYKRWNMNNLRLR